MPYTTLELIAGGLKNLFAIMSNIGRMACIVDSGREACGEANLAIDAAEEEDTKIRGQGASIEIGPDGMARNGMKTQLLWRRIGHGHTPPLYTE